MPPISSVSLDRLPRDADPAATQYATPALDKGLDILELLARQPSGLTKSQLARALHRTVSEIFRMLVCLERRGYIAQTPDDRYALTLKLFRLVQAHPPTDRLVTEALPVMKRFVNGALQSCHLGTLEAGYVVILAQVNSPADLGFQVKLGSTVDLMESASGYVILAHLPADDRERQIALWKQRLRRKTPAGLAAHLDRIRRRGYEKRASYLVKGVTNISFPVFGEHGTALAALTVPYIQYAAAQVSEAEVVRQLRRAATEIGAAVGCPAAAAMPAT
jgi:DNA-binding IclR family transcriptional regulator